MNRIRPKREERDRVTRRENEPRETQSLTVFHASLTGGSFSFNILTAISFVKSISCSFGNSLGRMTVSPR